MGGWTLLIDLGGAWTRVATLAHDAARPIDAESVWSIPSAVCWSERRHELLVGFAAVQVSVADCVWSEQRLGARLGQDRLPLAEDGVSVVDAVAALLTHVVGHAAEAYGGSPPAAVWMTTPAPSADLSRLRAGADAAGLGYAMLIARPVAVAASLRRAHQQPADRVAVYDLGATGFEACVLSRREGAVEPVGQPRRVEGGGDEFDRKLVSWLNDRLARDGHRSNTPQTSKGHIVDARAFTERVRAAKEQLSLTTTAWIEPPQPLGGRLSISRAEFESLIEGGVRDTVIALAGAIAEAGDVDTVCLAGGGAKIPLVGRMITDTVGLEPATDRDPGTAAIRGLAELALRGPADGRVSVAARDIPVALAAGDRRGPELVNALDEDVQFTVYRPRCLVPGHWHTLLAFAHKSDPVIDEILGESDPVEEVRSRAAARLGAKLGSYARTGQDSSRGIARGSEITFAPRVDGVEFNPPLRTFRWQEPVHQEEFRMLADAHLRGKRARGALSVYLGAVLIAEVSLNIRVGDTPGAAAADVERARPYRRIFFSYSRKDEAIVEQVEWALSTLGDEVMRDTRTLRAGEIWDERLEQMIRDAEIFQLFWSTHSMTSEFVSKEWRYALALERPHFIRPTYWEQPMPELPDADLPPAQLRALHFHALPASALPGPDRARAAAFGDPRSATAARAVQLSVSAGAAAPAPAPSPAPPRASGPSGSTSARRAAQPRLVPARAGLAGLALAALLATAVIGGAGLTGGGSSQRPISSATAERTGPTGETGSATTAEARRTPPAPPGASAEAHTTPAPTGATRSPQSPACAGCRIGGFDCPECAVREGTGPTDVGGIASSSGFLTWRNEGSGPFVMILDGGVVVHSMAGSGRLGLPLLRYSDLRIIAQRGWSIALH